MSSKPGKSSKKDDANASLTLEAITALLEEHRNALSTEFKTSFTLLDSKFDHMRLTVEGHGQRLSSLELASGDLSQRVLDLEGVCTALSANNTKLTAKLLNLESRSKTTKHTDSGFTGIHRKWPTNQIFLEVSTRAVWCRNLAAATGYRHGASLPRFQTSSGPMTEVGNSPPPPTPGERHSHQRGAEEGKARILWSSDPDRRGQLSRSS